jgi:hypothetical protein
MLGDMLRKPLNQEHKMEENYDLILPIKNILLTLHFKNFIEPIER